MIPVYKSKAVSYPSITGLFNCFAVISSFVTLTPITFADLQLGLTIEIKFVTSSKVIRKLEVE